MAPLPARRRCNATTSWQVMRGCRGQFSGIEGYRRHHFRRWFLVVLLYRPTAFAPVLEMASLMNRCRRLSLLAALLVWLSLYRLLRWHQHHAGTATRLTSLFQIRQAASRLAGEGQ